MTDRTLGTFVGDVARAQPTPAAGSVAAVSGAMAAALAELVCAITVDKPASVDVEADLRAVRADLFDRRARLLELAEEDAEAVEALMAADSANRAGPTRTATDVPLEIARQCGAVVEQAAAVAVSGSQTAVSDATASAELANAGLRAALATVDANLASLEDASFASAVEDEAEELVMAAEGDVERAREVLRNRL